jgi:Na+/proline symporter
MWVVLLGANVVTIGFSFFFGTRNTAQVLMAAGLAMTIALVLLAILAMQHPFAGITRVEPEAFNQFSDILDVRSQTGIGQAR